MNHDLDQIALEIAAIIDGWPAFVEHPTQEAARFALNKGIEIGRAQMREEAAAYHFLRAELHRNHALGCSPDSAAETEHKRRCNQHEVDGDAIRSIEL